jgi:hypothetical protein
MRDLLRSLPMIMGTFGPSPAFRWWQMKGVRNAIRLSRFKLHGQKEALIAEGFLSLGNRIMGSSLLQAVL